MLSYFWVPIIQSKALDFKHPNKKGQKWYSKL